MNADFSDLNVPSEWLAEFKAAARRSLAQRMRYAFIKTYKPVLDDAPYLSFDTMEECRRWCEDNLPEWLGFKRVPKDWVSAMPTFEYKQAEEIRDALARHRVHYSRILGSKKPTEVKRPALT